MKTQISRLAITQFLNYCRFPKFLKGFYFGHWVTQQNTTFEQTLLTWTPTKYKIDAVFFNVERALIRSGMTVFSTYSRKWVFYPTYQESSSHFLNLEPLEFLLTNQFQETEILQHIPHGSCLSTLLYLEYTIDLIVNQKASVALLLDNNLLLAKNYSKIWVILHLQNQIGVALSWFIK